MNNKDIKRRKKVVFINLFFAIYDTFYYGTKPGSKYDNGYYIHG